MATPVITERPVRTSGGLQRFPRARTTRIRDLVESWIAWRYLPWAIVALGVLLRVDRYLQHRSLWLDEALLALNLIGRSYDHLIHTLDYNQGAPLGFLFGERVVVSIAGDSERALRFLPFVAGIASLFVFYAVVQALLRRIGFLIALLLFATLEPFLFYSATAKQYEFDVLVTLILLALFLRVAAPNRPLTLRVAVLLAFAGAAVVWLSHPSVFVLIGFAVGLSITPLFRRDWRTVGTHAVIYATWLASFLVTYVLSVRKLGGLQASVVPTNAPASSPAHLLKSMYLIFSDPGLLPRTASGFAVVVAMVGAVVLARRNWRVPTVMVSAAAAAYVAAYAGKYPVNGRFLLFLLPAAVILVGAGVGEFASHVRWLPAAALLLGATVLLVLPPVIKAADHVVRPPLTEEIKPVLDEVSARWQRGETLYVFYASQYALRYYFQCSDCDGLTKQQRAIWPLRRAQGNSAQSSPALVGASPHVIIGSVKGHNAFVDYMADVHNLAGHGKVWLLFTHYYPLTQQDLLRPLDQAGRPIQCVAKGVAFACLYDFPRAG
jgi:hypothetical protein